MSNLDSQRIGDATDRAGLYYTLHFRGAEMMAVILGPLERFRALQSSAETPEVHREPATDAADARAKLLAWRRAQGWPV